MNRRHFLLSSSIAALGTMGRLRAAPSSSDSATEQLIDELVRANDARIPALLAKQERRANQRWTGGIANEDGLISAGGVAGFIAALACAACAPSSRYFKSIELAEPLRLASRSLVALQHEDGTIDLQTTNFHSTPDTAFVLENICPSFALLRASAEPRIAAPAEDLGTFIRRASEALITGGVHTPNHRWVVCGALAWVNALFPERRAVGRIDEWLAEGIDIDPDGQYTEKSTTVYSPIVDRALITVARLLDRPALLDPVRRNLEMTLYYVHPDGEVVTEASRRQDRYQRGSMARYYYAYRWLALRDGNGRFAAMARQIERTSRQQIGELLAFLAEPELRRALPADAPLPTNYSKVFAHSALARIRRGEISATVLANNPTIFSLRKGAAALEAVRLATAFFGKGQFEGAELDVREGRFVLRQELEGPYFQPLSPEQIAKGEHVRMAPNGTLAPGSKALRAPSNVQTLHASADITERAGKFTIAISIRGTEAVPVSIELAFREGGTLHGVEPLAGVKGAFLLREGTGRYATGSDTIEFGPGRVEHTYTQLRGALPKWEGQSVYLTGTTPFDLSLTIG